MLHSLKMLSDPWLSHLQNNPRSARAHKPFSGTAATFHVALSLPRIIGHSSTLLIFVEWMTKWIKPYHQLLIHTQFYHLCHKCIIQIYQFILANILSCNDSGMGYSFSQNWWNLSWGLGVAYLPLWNLTLTILQWLWWLEGWRFYLRYQSSYEIYPRPHLLEESGGVSRCPIHSSTQQSKRSQPAHVATGYTQH